MELVHLPRLSQALGPEGDSCLGDGKGEAPRCRALLALVDYDDEQALLRLRAALPDVCLVDLSSADFALVSADRQSEEAPFQQNHLTRRQSEIFALMLDGLSNKVIGRRIGISHFTVRNHVSKLLQILNISSRRDIRRALDQAVLTNDTRPCPARDRQIPSLGVPT